MRGRRRWTGRQVIAFRAHGRRLVSVIFDDIVYMTIPADPQKNQF